MKNKTVPIFWFCLVSTLALIILCIMGVPWVHWLLIPYPSLMYLSYIAILFLFGTKLVSVAFKNYKSGKESK